jgi:hypothetical protein
MAKTPESYADVDLTHKPSEVLRAIRTDILSRLEMQRGQIFGPTDRALMLFDEVVTAAQRQLARGRDS